MDHLEQGGQQQRPVPYCLSPFTKEQERRGWPSTALLTFMSGLFLKPKASYDIQHPAKPEDIDQEKLEREYIRIQTVREEGAVRMILLSDAHMQCLCIIPHFKWWRWEMKDFTKTSCYHKRSQSFTWYMEMGAIKTALPLDKTDRILESLRNGIEHCNCSLLLHGLHTSSTCNAGKSPPHKGTTGEGSEEDTNQRCGKVSFWAKSK